MGDGRFYAPTHVMPKPNKKAMETYDRIFEKNLKLARIKN